MSPPFAHRVVVGTLAVLAGAYVVYDTGKDFQFVKFEPHSEEEIARRKRDNVPMLMKHLETCTLDYTAEAKEKYKKALQKEEEAKKESQ